MNRVSLTIFCCLLLGNVAAEVTNEVRVLTYNIRFSSGDKGTANSWALRRDDLVSLMRQVNADVGGLQEVCPDQASYLRACFPDYVFVGEHREQDRISGEASPVFYRRQRFALEKEGTFWLSETPDVPGSKGWGALCPRVCSYAVLRDRVSDCRFCCASIHADNRSAVARERGISLVLERMRSLDGELPILLTGDHNCRETDSAECAVSKTLKNVLSVSETQPKGSWRSFNGWRWRDQEIQAVDALNLSPVIRNCDKMFYEQCGGSRIDFIYVSPEIHVKSVETVSAPRYGMKRYPSDHFPVVAGVYLVK